MTNPRVIIFKDAEDLSRAAAEQFVALARQSVNERRNFIVCLSGGMTPQRTYEILAESPYRESVSWQDTIVYFGDERCVPPDHKLLPSARRSRKPISAPPSSRLMPHQSQPTAPGGRVSSLHS